MYHHFLVEMPDEEEQTFLRNALLNVTNKDGFSLTDVFDLGKRNRTYKRSDQIN